MEKHVKREVNDKSDRGNGTQKDSWDSILDGEDEDLGEDQAMSTQRYPSDIVSKILGDARNKQLLNELLAELEMITDEELDEKALSTLDEPPKLEEASEKEPNKEASALPPTRKNEEASEGEPHKEASALPTLDEPPKMGDSTRDASVMQEILLADARKLKAEKFEEASALGMGTNEEQDEEASKSVEPPTRKLTKSQKKNRSRKKKNKLKDTAEAYDAELKQDNELRESISQVIALQVATNQELKRLSEAVNEQGETIKYYVQQRGETMKNSLTAMIDEKLKSRFKDFGPAIGREVSRILREGGFGEKSGQQLAKSVVPKILQDISQLKEEVIRVETTMKDGFTSLEARDSIFTSSSLLKPWSPFG